MKKRQQFLSIGRGCDKSPVYPEVVHAWTSVSSGPHTGQDSPDSLGMSTNQNQTQTWGAKMCHPPNHLTSEVGQPCSPWSLFLNGSHRVWKRRENGHCIWSPSPLPQFEPSHYWSQTSSTESLWNPVSLSSFPQCHWLLVTLLWCVGSSSPKVWENDSYWKDSHLIFPEWWDKCMVLTLSIWFHQIMMGKVSSYLWLALRFWMSEGKCFPHLSLSCARTRYAWKLESVASITYCVPVSS